MLCMELRGGAEGEQKRVGCLCMHSWERKKVQEKQEGKGLAF